MKNLVKRCEEAFITETEPPLSVVPLRMRHFARIAANGFGDPLNAYAHTMVWFGGHLYVGTTRANFCLIKARVPVPMSFWPVNCPEELFDIDLRAHIWRYSPADDKWENVHVAPWVATSDGRQMPREIGYRGMTVYQGPSDDAPCLYVSNWANRAGGQVAQILRSTDGREFIPVSRPGLVDATITTLRSLVPFRGRLFTSPVAHAGVTPNVPASPVVLATIDPTKDDWQIACAPGFGDDNNKTIFEMAVFNDKLYAGTLNPLRGFQLWKTDATGDPPYRWTLVITDGAYRGNLNECVVSMRVFGNALYVGSGIQNGGHDRTYNIGPAAAEIIRVHPDDSWDLVVGMQRPTPQGRKFPLSGLGPGFGNFFNGYIWRIREHAGCLYAGTCDWSTLIPFVVSAWADGNKPQKAPQGELAAMFNRLMQWIGPENLVKFEGGFDLWRTEDGARWTPVTTNGFGNPYNYGVRTMVSTPYGLFLGTANPFGPEIATRTPAGWHYEPNPQGGAEVWWGR
jgi:hypothetical protein